MKKNICLWIIALLCIAAVLPGSLAVYGGANYDPPTTTTTTTTASSSGGGGGGGGGGVTTTTVDFTAEAVKEVKMSKLDKVKFDMLGESHIAKLIDVGDDFVTLTISSDTITITMYVGEVKYVDFNKDGLNDLKITLKSVVLKRATLVYESLVKSSMAAAMAVAEPKVFAPPETTSDESSVTAGTIERAVDWSLIIVIAVIAVLVLVFVGVKEGWFRQRKPTSKPVIGIRKRKRLK